MTQTKKPTITIIGAGLTGCFMAILLAKRGYRVNIYERAAKEDIVVAASKRSFNITFYRYGERVLNEAGLWDLMRQEVLILKGSMTFITKHSTPVYTPWQDKAMPHYCIPRDRMLKVLLEESLRHPLISVQFETSLLSINRTDKIILVQNERSKEISCVMCEVVLGADGVNSITRSSMQLGQHGYHSQVYADWGYKQIIFSKELAERLKLNEKIVYTWSDKEKIIISHPNIDGSRATLLALPKDGKKGFAALRSESAIAEFVKSQFPNLLLALPAMTEAVLGNPEGNFVTLHTSPWYYKDFIAILGDAAHAFYPFFGQGVSAGFGDCVVLAELLDLHAGNWKEVFPLYQQARKVHMDYLGELSKEVFGMYKRETKADYWFIYNRFEQLLHELFPRLVVAPVSDLIANDPGHTAEYAQQHKRLRKITKLMGAPILVAIVMRIVALWEKVF